MKHYSAAALERQIGRAFPKPMVGEDRLKEALRGQLNGTDAAKRALAQRLGITPHRLSLIVRGHHPVPDAVAERLGFRRVSMFEPID